MAQSPMISSPLKQTNEIDWVAPLKSYIRDSYGDDPERYNEECNMLNRLRQDMRGAGKDSASGRDLLYRYYGQLELLDLRFPVDENHIKISFTWFDAFTHKPTAQFSLAYEKASIIYNISAVLSCHAANQNRFEETGLKTAYHSFQAAAGMFTYINENFLHAPSADLSRDTVKTLIHVMLAQAQEVFLEKQIADDKKVGLLAKLASQGAYLYGQALEGAQENVNKGIFERIWLTHITVKQNHMCAVAQYYQALADDDANNHGTAICRLQVAESLGKDANRLATSFPTNIPANTNLTPETGPVLIDITRRHLANVQQKLALFVKDNDFIYHQPVPSEASLTSIPKLPAAKPIPVSELYQGQDIQKIIGPDIFQRIVPMAVTESASLYDEEKAKLIRAETERVEIANDEMAASFDYLKLPSSLDALKGIKDQELSVDREFSRWCEELAGHAPFSEAFDELNANKKSILEQLEQNQRNLDMEESVCEKMRSKYGDDWSQQPSSRLTSTLRSDVRNYRSAVEEASTSDTRLYSTFRQYEAEFEEMRSAGETDEADVLYQRAMLKAGASRGASNAGEGSLLDDDFQGGPSVTDQIADVEELMKRLRMVSKEREQVLKDLKEKVHNDDISNVLILNKKSITGQDSQIFKAELEKFRPHQNRILQAIHKQKSLLNELTRTYDALLQDRRVRSEQTKYEAFGRQKGTVLNKYRKAYQAFNDLVTGLMRAQGFYSEMKDTVESQAKNVESFVSNRRNEGGALLSSIEASKAGGNNGLVDWERGGLNQLMERLNVDNGSPSPAANQSRTPQPGQPYHAPYNPQNQRPMSTQYTPGFQPIQAGSHQSAQQPYAYNPQHHGPVSPPPQATTFAQAGQAPGQYFSPPPNNANAWPPTAVVSSPPPNRFSMGYGHSPQPQQHPPPQGHGPSSSQQQPNPQQHLPPGWQPPPPPPGPPPAQADMNFGLGADSGPRYPSGPGGYAGSGAQRQGGQQQQPQGQSNPYDSLNRWG